MRADRVGGDPRSILVIQTAFLGDVVLTTPLFRALRRLYPRARLAALVTPQAAPLIEEDPHLDEVLRYDKNGGGGLLGIARRVRGGRFDLLLSPHRSHRSALLALLSGIPLRIGFAESGFRLAYHRSVKRPSEAHEVDRNLALLAALGAQPEPSDRVLSCGYSIEEERAVRAILASEGISEGMRLVGIAPGSVWATKRWLPEGFARLARILMDRGFGVVLLGGPEDRETAERVAGGLPAPGRWINAAGRTSLKALAAWMDRLSVLVTNDSAPVHVAAARGTPTVALFGATVRSLGFAPFHASSRVVEVELACRPCGPHGGKTCPEGHFRCMRDIDPERVAASCLELLETSPEARAR